MILFFVIIIPVLLITSIIVYNYFTAPVLISTEKSDNIMVSFLIPARNEERNIGKCLENILAQNYSNYEIIVCNDESTDKTAEIVKDFAQNNSNIFLINSKNLPEGFTGKNWACHQLAKEAKGELFLFMDADVELTPSAVNSAVTEIRKNNLNMLSVFPTQKIKSLGEWLIIPLMNWLLLSFLPLKKVYSSRNVSLTAANGQFILWDKNIYFNLGGHEKFKSEIVEDMAFARAAKKNGYKIKTFLGGELINCRMYRNYDESFNGFSKNFFTGFNTTEINFSFMLLLFVIIYLFPFYFINSIYFLFIIILLLIGRVIISIKSRQNVLLNILLHPFQIIMLIIIGINSVLLTKSRRRKWKGRFL